MKMGPLALGSIAAITPLAMGVGAVPGVEPVPIWMALIAAAVGPSLVALVYGLGRAGLLTAVGYIRGAAQAKKKKAAEMLSDKDPKNDLEAKKLLISAEAELGAAAALEKAADGIKPGE